jgi:hypothetical protein
MIGRRVDNSWLYSGPRSAKLGAKDEVLVVGKDSSRDLGRDKEPVGSKYSADICKYDKYADA